MIHLQPLTAGHANFSRLRGVSTYSTILSCATICDPLLPHMMGGLDPNHLRAGGAYDPQGKEVRSMPPQSILQTYLDDIGKAVMDERFEIYAEMIELPLTILTSSARLKIDTLDALEQGFDAFTDMLQGFGVTRMVRTVKQARFQGNDHIVGLYETRLMSGSRQALPTFHSKMWIGTYDGAWKAIRINNTTNDARWPMLLTRLAPPPWLPEES
jgi:hypothetical protein